MWDLRGTIAAEGSVMASRQVCNSHPELQTLPSLRLPNRDKRSKCFYAAVGYFLLQLGTLNPWFGAVKEPKTFTTCLSINKKLSKTMFLSIKYMFLKPSRLYSHVALMWLDSLVQEAALWFKRKRGTKQKQVKACKSLFLFIVKIGFPAAQPLHLVFPQAASHTGCSLPLPPPPPPRLWARHRDVLKGEAHICMHAFSMLATCLIAPAAQHCGFYSYKDFPVK